jgi:hypothetical protein
MQVYITGSLNCDNVLIDIGSTYLILYACIRSSIGWFTVGRVLFQSCKADT